MYRNIKFDIVSKFEGLERVKCVDLKWATNEQGEEFVLATGDNDVVYKIDWEENFLLQSSEQFDKNGRLVYQGHILKDNEGNHFEVFYALGSFFIAKDVDSDRVLLDDALLINLEIVGDIFNNPELVLKKIDEEEFSNKITQNNESTEN